MALRKLKTLKEIRTDYKNVIKGMNGLVRELEMLSDEMNKVEDFDGLGEDEHSWIEENIYECNGVDEKLFELYSMTLAQRNYVKEARRNKK